MKEATSQRGSALVLVVSVFLVLAIAVAFVCMNYGQLFGTHKQAQTAIDAAALQAAKDIGRIVVNDPDLGLVGLLDDTPPDNRPTGKPVMGINTVMAVARLDTIIARALGNETMLFLARQDQQRARQAAARLRNAVNAAIASGRGTDKNGNAIHISRNAEQAYDNNSRRMGMNNDGRSRVGPLRIQVGALQPGHGETNIPVPSPANHSQNLTNDNNTALVSLNGQTRRVYRPYMNIPVSGIDFMFAAVGEEPMLVDKGRFENLRADMAIPAVVRVEATERVNAVAPHSQAGNPNEGGNTGTIIAVACAQAGGSRPTFPSGVLSVEFPQGFPPEVGQVSFRSVRSIMNSMQLPNGQGPSPTTAVTSGWSATGTWFRAEGGPVPFSTQGNPSGLIRERPFNGRTGDNGSVALSFMVYDWLRACGLRPNVQAVVNALDANFRPFTNGGGAIYSSKNDWLVPAAYAQSSNPDVPVAGAILAMEVSQSGLENDPRNLKNYANDPETYSQQMLTSWGYVPAANVMADVPTARRTALDPATGNPITTDGAPVSNLYDFDVDVRRLGEMGQRVYDAAKVIRDQKKSEADQAAGEEAAAQSEVNNLASQRDQAQSDLDALRSDEIDDSEQSSQINSLQQRINDLNNQIANKESERDQARQTKENARRIQRKAEYAMTNGNYATLVRYQIDMNMGALTGAGLTKIADTHYMVMHTNRFAGTPDPANNWSVQQIQDAILNEADSLPTLQVAEAAGSKNWLSAPAGANPVTGAGGTPSVEFLKIRSGAIQIGKGKDKYMQHALAQSATVPLQNFFFYYTIIGDSSKNESEGSVRFRTTTNSPFGDVPDPRFVNPGVIMNTLQGQVQFQSLNGLVSLGTTGNPPVGVTWSVQARDLYGNPRGTWFADTRADGYVVNPANWCQRPGFGSTFESGSGTCYSLVSQWQLRSPMPVCPDGVNRNSCCPRLNVSSADGTVSAVYEACPPPPPRDH